MQSTLSGGSLELQKPFEARAWNERLPSSRFAWGSSLAARDILPPIDRLGRKLEYPRDVERQESFSSSSKQIDYALTPSRKRRRSDGVGGDDEEGNTSQRHAAARKASAQGEWPPQMLTALLGERTPY